MSQKGIVLLRVTNLLPVAKNVGLVLEPWLGTIFVNPNETIELVKYESKRPKKGKEVIQ